MSRQYTLTFHGVGQKPPDLSPQDAHVWLDESDFVDVLDGVRGRPDIAITFDDGNESDVEIALPRLLERGLRATFFLVAGRVGTPGYVDERGARTLREAGMVIGSHGFEHRAWRGLGRSELRRELIESRSYLGSLMEQRIEACAAPMGAYDRTVLLAARRAGYTRFFTSDRGPARRSAWLHPRSSLHAGDAVAELERVLESPRRMRASAVAKRALKASR